MNDTNTTLNDFVNGLFDPADGEVVCIAQAYEWTDAAGNERHAYRHFPYSESLADTIARRPGEWYVCASTVKAVAEGAKLRRRKSDCVATFVLLLDDIGTKIDREWLDAELSARGLAPGVIIETSAGNFQYLFLIEPVEDVAHFEACNRAIVQAGFGDAGATGVSRVFRIPGSINSKPGRDNFPATLHTWAPDRIYELDAIMAALELEPMAKVSSDAGPFDASSFEPIEVPEDFDDPGLKWLEDKGRVIGFGDDFITVQCPNAHEHTDGNPGAGYSPVGHGEYPLYRTFHCFHEHCTSWNASRFLVWMAEQGGPTLASVGVSELRRDELLDLADDLTLSEKLELMRANLPPLYKNNLPDCLYGKPDRNGIMHPLLGQLATAPNVEYVCKQYGIRARHNMMNHEMTCSFTDPNIATIVTENPSDEAFQVIADGCMRVGIKGRQDVADAVNLAASRDRYHPMEEWIRAGEWDGVSRFQALADTVQVTDEYAVIWPIYLRRWLIQCVQAVCGWRNPQQISSVLVLAGAQGTFKTSWLAALVPPEWFNEGVHLDLKSGGGAARDSVSVATRRPICELGELEVTFKKADAGALKAFLARGEDIYRQPYGRRDIEWPRCTSFAGSVNRLDFLVDETGSRRYLPVEVVRCDSRHGLDMHQIWCEMYHYWQAGESWVLTESENDLRAEQADRFRAIPEAEEAAEQWLISHDTEFRPMNRRDFCELIGVKPNNQNLSIVLNVLNRRLGKSLRSLAGKQNAWSVPTQSTNLIEKALKRETDVKANPKRFNSEKVF